VTWEWYHVGPSAVVALTSRIDPERFAGRVPWNRPNDPLTLGVNVTVPPAFQERTGRFAGKPIAPEQHFSFFFEYWGIGGALAERLNELLSGVLDLLPVVAVLVLGSLCTGCGNLRCHIGQGPGVNTRVDF
jgi:hypothetical protein